MWGMWRNSRVFQCGSYSYKVGVGIIFCVYSYIWWNYCIYNSLYNNTRRIIGGEKMDYVTLDKIIEDLELEIIYEAKDMDKIKIKGSEVNRPGLQLAGYFDRFAYERLQIIGNVEWHYLDNLSKEVRYNRFKNMFIYPIPALIISRGLEIFPEIMDLAKKYNITILRTKLPTTKFINILINYLDYMLAPEMTVHGVLIEVYGMGILIVGKSGVGKSETALELIKRGHRLVADDVVEIKRVEEGLRGKHQN